MSKPMYVQCHLCDARWKVCDIPIEAGRFVDLLLRLHCPHCSASPKQIALCDPEGPHAVTEPRDPDPAKLAAAKARTKKGSK